MTTEIVQIFEGSNHGIGSDVEWSKEVEHLTVISSSPQQDAYCLDQVAGRQIQTWSLMYAMYMLMMLPGLSVKRPPGRG